ncbi:MAG: metallophosphoesterase, partial [Lachnospiraceae bacterium]|nr:metallophosphoesterase [Lachnospiraceae bacterium]
EPVSGESDGKIFISGNEPYEKMIRLLTRLAKKYPVYYGYGNHESRLYRRREKFGSAYEEVCLTLEHIGVHILSNKHQEVLINGTPVCIYGLDIERDYYKRVEKIVMDPAYVTSKLGKAEDNDHGINLLIAHNPEYFEAYEAWGADVTFSGHLHGGMVRIPGIGGVISPQLRFFPKYSGGIYLRNGRAEVVSKGIGAHGPDIRVFNRAEVVVVNIER